LLDGSGQHLLSVGKEGLVLDPVKEGGAVEGFAEDVRGREAERGDDVPLDPGGGGGREPQAGQGGEEGAHFFQAPVRRPKIVAPLRDAVCLVDDESSEEFAGVELLEDGKEGGGGQALWGHVQELDAGLRSKTKVVEDVFVEIGIQGGAAVAGVYTLFSQGGNLVVHERDQRRHNDSDPVQEERRQLVT